MRKSTSALKAMWADRRGLTALEYGLIGSILFSVIFLGFSVLANDLSVEFAHIGGGL
jgi:Flp pilus assembly pilin Flp